MTDTSRMCMTQHALTWSNSSLVATWRTPFFADRSSAGCVSHHTKRASKQEHHRSDNCFTWPRELLTCCAPSSARRPLT